MMGTISMNECRISQVLNVVRAVPGDSLLPVGVMVAGPFSARSALSGPQLFARLLPHLLILGWISPSGFSTPNQLLSSITTKQP